MRKKFTAVLAGSMLLVGMMGTAATANPLWDEGDVVVESDSFDVEVEVPEGEGGERPEQDADITLDGPTELDIHEWGEFTVTVESTGEIALSSWALGLEVDNITNVKNVDIRHTGGDGFDITAGTEMVDVELEDGVLYLLGNGNPVVEDSVEFEFDIAFRKEGSFTGAAFVVDPHRDVEVRANHPQYYPQYGAGQSSGWDADPWPVTAVEADVPEDYQCSLSRYRWDLTDEDGQTRYDNRLRCYHLDSGEIFYEHLLVSASELDPLWRTAQARNGREQEFSGLDYRYLSVDVWLPEDGDYSDEDYGGWNSVDVGDEDDLDFWGI